jgi:hypothetical protein
MALVLSDELINFLTGTPRLAFVNDMSGISNAISNSSILAELVKCYVHRPMDESLTLPFYSSRNIANIKHYIQDLPDVDMDLNDEQQYILASFLNNQPPVQASNVRL